MDVRPIDGNALAKGLETHADSLKASWVMDRHEMHVRKSAYINAACMARSAPTLDLAPKWISVKDRLPPDKGKSILVVNGHGYVRVLAFWNKNDVRWKWIDPNGRFKYFNDITHWMPLPEPPKEG